MARIPALQWRPALTLDPASSCGSVASHPSTRAVTSEGTPTALTSTESGLIEVLMMRRESAVVSRRATAVQVWDDEADAVGSNAIDVHVGRLWARVACGIAHLDTTRGIGFRLIALSP